MNKEIIKINGKDYERCIKDLAFRPVGTNIYSLAYKYWTSMINRTLDKDCQGNIEKWYKGKVVCCDEWLYFDIFEEFFKEKYYPINLERIEMDKDLICDILGLEIKIYSPETVVFLPKSINNLLTYRQNERSISHDGTTLPCNVKEHYTKRGYKYNGQVRFGKDANGNEIRKTSPFRSTIEESWEDVYIMKKQAICERAEEYKEYLPKEVYLMLLSYEPKKY